MRKTIFIMQYKSITDAASIIQKAAEEAYYAEQREKSVKCRAIIEQTQKEFENVFSEFLPLLDADDIEYYADLKTTQADPDAQRVIYLVKEPRIMRIFWKSPNMFTWIEADEAGLSYVKWDSYPDVNIKERFILDVYKTLLKP